MMQNVKNTGTLRMINDCRFIYFSLRRNKTLVEAVWYEKNFTVSSEIFLKGTLRAYDLRKC